MSASVVFGADLHGRGQTADICGEGSLPIDEVAGAGGSVRVASQVVAVAAARRAAWAGQRREQVGPALLRRPDDARGAVGEALAALEGVHAHGPADALLRAQDGAGEHHAVVGRPGERPAQRDPVGLLPVGLRWVEELRLEAQPGPLHPPRQVRGAQAGAGRQHLRLDAARDLREQADVRRSRTLAW